MDKNALKRILSEFPWLWALSDYWKPQKDKVTIYRGEKKFRRFIFEMRFFCDKENLNRFTEFEVYIKYDCHQEGVLKIIPTKGMPPFLGYYDSFFQNAKSHLAKYVCILWRGTERGPLMEDERDFMVFPLPQNWQEIAKSAFEAC